MNIEFSPLYIILFIILLCIYFYNRLISSKQNVHEAWSGIDVQLKRRHDLIPNLIAIVKGYSNHESKIFTQIAEERTQAITNQDKDVGTIGTIETKIQGTLKSLFAVAENYPDLKANQHYLQLQTDIRETEDQIASARRIYNSNVADYNTLIRSFPANIIAGMGNFKHASFFQQT